MDPPPPMDPKQDPASQGSSHPADEAYLLAQLQQLHAQLQELRRSGKAHGAAGGHGLSPAPPAMDEPMILVTAKQLDFSLPVGLPVTVLEAPRMVTNGFVGASVNPFSTGCLWPLFHSIPSHFGDTLLHPHMATFYQDYVALNVRMLELTASLISSATSSGEEPPSIVVYDFELMLLPNLLRRRFPDVSICFFLCIPFPSSEFFNVLPMRQELLRGVLGADLVSFNHFDYVTHFLSACTHVLGLETTPSRFTYEGRLVSLSICPLGVHPQDFNTTSDEMQKAIRHLSAKLKDPCGNARGRQRRKVIISVDKLDACSGIPEKLMAFQALLVKYPEHRQSTTLYLVLDAHLNMGNSRLDRRLNELVGTLNGKFGSADYCPVRYIRRRLDRKQLVALYAVADVALVTSLREGINLRAMEFVLCQPYGDEGVLVYSEFAGCAASLKGALIVNPYHTEVVADAVYRALSMPATTRKVFHHQLLQYATAYTSGAWANRLISELSRAAESARECNRAIHLELGDIKSFYERSGQRLFVLDYEGTLWRFEAVKELLRVTPELRTVLRDLAGDPKNRVYICSRRGRMDLDHWFGDIPHLGLIAENGFWVKPAGGVFSDSSTTHISPKLMAMRTHRSPRRSVDLNNGMSLPLAEPSTASEGASRSLMDRLQELADASEPGPLTRGHLSHHSIMSQVGMDLGSPGAAMSMTPGSEIDWEPQWQCFGSASLDLSWKKRMTAILRQATEATPGSLLEVGESCVTWHFRDTDADFGLMRAKQLQLHFDEVLSSQPVRTQLLLNRKCLVVHPASINRSRMFNRLLRETHKRQNFDCIFIASTVRAAEDQYFDAARGAHSFTCTVGKAVSRAQYYVDDSTELLKTLQALATLSAILTANSSTPLPMGPS